MRGPNQTPIIYALFLSSYTDGVRSISLYIIGQAGKENVLQ